MPNAGKSQNITFQIQPYYLLVYCFRPNFSKLFFNLQFDNEGWTTMTNQIQVEIRRDKTTLSLNSQCLPCLGGNLILNNTTDTLK